MTWHLFPEERPEDLNWYIVTYTDRDNVRTVGMARYIGGRFGDLAVDAWQELPPPYGITVGNVRSRKETTEEQGDEAD